VISQPSGGEAYDTSRYTVTAECAMSGFGAPLYVARLRDGDEQGFGPTTAEAIADLHEARRWREERQREAAAPPGRCFTRALDDLLGIVTRLGWEVTAQRAAFDRDAPGGTVELTLHLAGQASDAVVTVFPPSPGARTTGTP